MIKSLCTFLLFFIFSFHFPVNVVNAADAPSSPEEFYADFEFKHVGEALDECEANFNKKLVLPFKLPPLVFTHQFGKCNEKDGIFEIMYINENSPEIHYKVRVRPVENKRTFDDKHIDKKIKLDDGAEAFYITTLVQGFHLLVFERKGWQYMLCVDKRVSEKVPPEVLVTIANSFFKPK